MTRSRGGLYLDDRDYIVGSFPELGNVNVEMFELTPPRMFKYYL